MSSFASADTLVVTWLAFAYSLACFKACNSISSEIRKSVCLILSRIGLMLESMPLSFAFMITPMVPV